MIPFGDIGTHIESVLGGPVTGTRYASISVTDGNVIYGDPTPLSFTASVQPVTPKEVMKLPEGERTKEAISIFSTFVLRTSDVEAQTPSDEINWAGRTYRVILVENWSAQVNYMKAIAVRIHE